MGWGGLTDPLKLARAAEYAQELSKEARHRRRVERRAINFYLHNKATQASKQAHKDFLMEYTQENLDLLRKKYVAEKRAELEARAKVKFD